jgi:sulfur-oxidizing protein SoxZ
MKIKAKLKDGIVDVKAMAKHEMLTYDVAKKKGTDANFIVHMIATVNKKVVFEMSSSQFLSKNPIISFKFKGAAAGDKLTMTWVDLKGNTETSDTEIR